MAIGAVSARVMPSRQPVRGVIRFLDMGRYSPWFVKRLVDEYVESGAVIVVGEENGETISGRAATGFGVAGNEVVLAKAQLQLCSTGAVGDGIVSRILAVPADLIEADNGIAKQEVVIQFLVVHLAATRADICTRTLCASRSSHSDTLMISPAVRISLSQHRI